MERTTVFSAVLVINIFSITDSADQNNIVRDIKQDAIIAHAQAIRGLGVVQMFDVAMQSQFCSCGKRSFVMGCMASSLFS
jgi:hypothetical protein